MPNGKGVRMCVEVVVFAFFAGFTLAALITVVSDAQKKERGQR